jgi:hypothetical protein
MLLQLVQLAHLVIILWQGLHHAPCALMDFNVLTQKTWYPFLAALASTKWALVRTWEVTCQLVHCVQRGMSVPSLMRPPWHALTDLMLWLGSNTVHSALQALLAQTKTARES